MKIKKIEVTNFMGINGTVSIELPRLGALCGRNGIGKTSILTAIRYGLTGVKPADKDIINKSCEEATVSITMEHMANNEDYTFTRVDCRNHPSKFKINGKTSTQKAMHELIEACCGIPIDKIKILSSADVVANMKPQALGAFLMDYIPEKIRLEDVLVYMPYATSGSSKICAENLPEEGIELEHIEKLYELCRERRKSIKAGITQKKALLETLPKQTPAFEEEALKQKRIQLLNAENEYKLYLTKKDAYEKSLVSYKKWEENMRKLENDIQAITIPRPDIADREKYKAAIADYHATITNLNVSMNAMVQSNESHQRELNALQSPVCPLSNKIRCNQDKTVAKAEIEQAIVENNRGILATKSELAKVQAKLDETSKLMDEWNRLAVIYNNKIALKKQYKNLYYSQPEVLAMPEAVAKPNVEDQMREIEAALSEIEKYKKAQNTLKELDTLQIQYTDYDYLVSVLSEKGPVRNGVISSYLGVFEEVCNECSSKARPDVHFRFVSDDGVVILMDNGKGTELPYSCLSGGEQAYMLFIVMDMLNRLCGSNLLLLDELSIMDEACFEALIKNISYYTNDYDHILIASVSHPNLEKLLNSYKFNILHF